MDVIHQGINLVLKALSFNTFNKSVPMSSKTTPLNEFLRNTKAAFEATRGDEEGNWVIVTGNEAGDLDSVASAVAYAYLSGQPNVIPLVQTPRSDLHLRPENILAFSRAGIDPAVLMTVSELPAPPAKQPSGFVLVDHNRLLPSLDGSVQAILDHHDDEQQHKDAKPRVIEPVGSCASLVTVHFKDKWSTESSENLQAVAILLLGAILIDTNGLKRGGKATSTDVQAANLLIPHTQLVPATSTIRAEDQLPSPLENFSRELAKTKANVDHLSARDLLRRDYKEYVVGNTRVGLSSVPLGLKKMVKRNTTQFWNDVDGWMADQRLDILGVLTSYRSEKRKKHRRQLLFVVKPNQLELEKKLFDGINGSEELQCEERRIAGLGSRRARCWRQGNVKATRKAVAPLVKKLIA